MTPFTIDEIERARRIAARYDDGHLMERIAAAIREAERAAYAHAGDIAARWYGYKRLPDEPREPHLKQLRALAVSATPEEKPE